MRKAFRLLTIYAVVVIVCFTILLSGIGSILSNDSIYKTPPDRPILLIGASQTAYGVNDSFVHNIYNLSSPGDAFVYTYFKLRKVLPLNPQIKTVVLSVSEQLITKRLADLWLRNENFVNIKSLSYFHLVDLKQLGFSFVHNPEQVIKDFVSIPKAKSGLCVDILKHKNVTIQDLQLGGYEVEKANIVALKNRRTQTEETPAAKKNRQDIADMYAADPMPVSDWQIEYLRKIVDFCKERNVKIIFLRTPEHPTWEAKNEKIFMDLLHNDFSTVPFIDCRNMPFPDTCFTDLVHINYYAAKPFADSVERLIQEQLK